MESDMLRGYELKADDYMTKPFPMSIFQKKVSILCAIPLIAITVFIPLLYYRKMTRKALLNS